MKWVQIIIDKEKKAKQKLWKESDLKLHHLLIVIKLINKQKINQIKTSLMVFRFLPSVTEERRKEMGGTFRMGGTLTSSTMF